jgi:4-hydroxybenzoate polyprenyltransferase
MRKALLLFDLARSRSALLSVGEPVLGAMLAGRDIPSLRVSLLGLLAALAGYFCVYSLNDLLDLRADREEVRVASSDPQTWQPAVAHIDITTLRHPVAAGALPLWAAVVWVSVLGVVGLAAAYFLRPLCAWLFIACALLQVLYCALRRRTWLKTVPAGVLVALGGLAGWFAVGEATWGTVAFFVLLFLWEVAGRNLSNDLADVTHDRVVGITTLASVRGTRAALTAITAGAALMPLVALAQPGPWTSRLLLCGAALATMTAPALLLRRSARAHQASPPAEGESMQQAAMLEASAQRYFNRASLFPAVAAALLILLALWMRLT